MPRTLTPDSSAISSSVSSVRYCVRAAMRGLGLPERRPHAFPNYRELRQMPIIRSLHLGHQWLIDYAIQVLSMLDAPLRNRFLECSRQTRQSVLARMYGFEKCWHPLCPWTRDELMHMLVKNENKLHPRFWRVTWVALPPPEHVAQLPLVAEWLRNYTPLSEKTTLFVVVTNDDRLLKMRYEEWTLWEPGLRLEKVLAYRAQPCGVCACCERPAFWKLPHGRLGCAESIMRTVGPLVAGRTWPEMSQWLSRSKSSPLERLLAQDFVSTTVFETLFFDVHCLSCSCGRCSLKDMQAGVLCLHDQNYVVHERAGPESPRSPCGNLCDSDDEALWEASAVPAAQGGSVGEAP